MRVRQSLRADLGVAMRKPLAGRQSLASYAGQLAWRPASTQVRYAQPECERTIISHRPLHLPPQLQQSHEPLQTSVFDSNLVQSLTHSVQCLHPPMHAPFLCPPPSPHNLLSPLLLTLCTRPNTNRTHSRPASSPPLTPLLGSSGSGYPLAAGSRLPKSPSCPGSRQKPLLSALCLARSRSRSGP
ncbi:hypothetical protein ElyMa_006870700 [Elysia marginata]|uniref:Uncharacterized protein n=1 Tax=Elysia marginata TaxID=1093978 RepID=A0AAV4JBL4_9GAST|nr:hypothetical protein ElyMa_006870700 [Elysia marginata]